MLHAANEAIAPQVMNQTEIFRWWAVNIYQTLGRTGVPLFVMLTGALLLQPSKIEPLSIFFKKRWARIGLPFLFWGAIYFAWDYFAENISLTSSFIAQGILSGPYYQFWYLYMIVGLYLFTPILRVVVAHVNRETFKYFLGVWFFAVVISPIPGLFGEFHVDGNLLMIPGWIGYFLLGVFLLSVKLRRSTTVGLMTLWIGFNGGWNLRDSCHDWRTKNIFLPRLLQPNHDSIRSHAISTARTHLKLQQTQQ